MSGQDRRVAVWENLRQSPDLVGRLALAAAILLPALVVIMQLAAARGRAAQGIVDIKGIEVAVFVVPFLALCLSAVVLTLAGLARLSPVPVVAFTIVGSFPNAATFSHGLAGLFRDAPLADRVLGAALALLPALLLYRARVVEQRRLRGLTARDKQAVLASCVLVAIAVVSVVATWNVVRGKGLLASSDRVAAVLGLGACLALGSSRWRLAVIPVALLLAGVAHTFVVPDLPALDPAWPVAWLYLCVLGLVASAWIPAAALFETLGERPLTLFVLTNLLNGADAIGTAIAVGSGRAEELNPIVRAVGLPVKVILVGSMTWLVMRYRPRWMWVPLVALCGVVIWHLGGIAINYRQ